MIFDVYLFCSGNRTEKILTDVEKEVETTATTTPTTTGAATAENGPVCKSELVNRGIGNVYNT